MKERLTLVLVLVWTSTAGAGLTLVNTPTGPIQIGQTVTITVRSTTGGNYCGWLEITNPDTADFSGPPQFTPAGDPGGASTIISWQAFGAWYEFTVAALPGGPAIAPGDHLLISITGVSPGTTRLNLYADDGIQLWESLKISVSAVPEPATIGLLGLGGLLLLCRR